MSDRFHRWNQACRVLLCTLGGIAFSLSSDVAWGQATSDSWEQIAADAIAAADLPQEQKSALILRAIRQAQLEAQRDSSPRVLGHHPLTPMAPVLPDVDMARVSPPRGSFPSSGEPLRLSKRVPAQLPHFQFGVESELQQPLVPGAPAAGPSHSFLSPDWSWSSVLSPRPVWNMLQPRFPEQEQRLSTRPEAITPATGPMNLHR